MPIDICEPEMLLYKLFLIRPWDEQVLVLPTMDGYQIPALSISAFARPIEELQNRVRSGWKLDAVFVGITCPVEGGLPCAIGEPLYMAGGTEHLIAVPFRNLQSQHLTDLERELIEGLMLGSRMDGCEIGRFGWIDEAVRWVEKTASIAKCMKRDIQQYNAGGGFALLRIPMDRGPAFWLKATGAPNRHECAVTTVLSELCPEHAPIVVATRTDWNAWLMVEDGDLLELSPSSVAAASNVLRSAIRSMATIQQVSRGSKPALSAAGVFDQSPSVLLGIVEDLFAYLEEAMALQTSLKVAPLGSARLREICSVLKEVCWRTQELNLPATIIHGDLNRGNILAVSGRCRFIDWCEAYWGPPVVSLQHLLLLNPQKGDPSRVSEFELRDAYVSSWEDGADRTSLEKAMPFMPLLAIASTLCGRGDWLNTPLRHDPRRQAYTRGLARHMERAVRDPELQEVLCS